MAAPKGNTNANKAKIWSDAVRKAILMNGRLDLLANSLINKALEGDIPALKEIGDRLEGKPAQVQIVQGDEDGGAVKTHIQITFVE
jgi:hypothetical protein